MDATMWLWAAIAAGVLAVLYGVFSMTAILRLPAGNARMQEIAAAIQEGAAAYLNRQYTTIAAVGVVIFALAFYFLGWQVAVGFLVGALLSGAAGYVGMYVSVRANVRTAEAARSGLAAGLSVAFRSGAVTGMLVVGLGLLAVAGYYAILTLGMGLDLGYPDHDEDDDHREYRQPGADAQPEDPLKHLSLPGRPGRRSWAAGARCSPGSCG